MFYRVPAATRYVMLMMNRGTTCAKRCPAIAGIGGVLAGQVFKMADSDNTVSMRFALLGIDDDALDLAQAVIDDAAHEVVALFDAPKDFDLLPSVLRQSGWETLLDESTADAVIVASDFESEVRGEQLRRLVQAGIPLLVVHPACPAILAFELEMIQHDVGGPLVAYHPAALSESLARMISAAGQEEDPIEQIVIERRMKNRTQRAVWRQLARDADLVRSIMGNVRELTAVASGNDEMAYANLSVTMAFASNCVCRWSVLPTVDEEFGVVALIRAQGRLEWRLNDRDRKSGLNKFLGEKSVDEILASPSNSAVHAIAHFVEHCRRADDGSHWKNTARALEVADAVPPSLRRRRAIDFHLEEHTEQQTFKSMMAAGSCLMLFLTVVAIFLMTTMAKLLTSWPIFRVLPIALLALLVCFLLLQLLGGKPASENETKEEK